MDKETLSNYGWIVICVLVLAVMIALATPFGNFIAGAIKSTTAGFFSVNENALSAAGITIPGQDFQDTENNTPATLGCDTLYWDGNTDGLVNTNVFYKVSDVLPTEDDFSNGYIVSIGDESFEVNKDTFDDEYIIISNNVLLGASVVVAYEDGANYNDISFPEAGLYFMNGDDGIVTSLTIPGYTGFPHSEHCGH